MATKERFQNPVIGDDLILRLFTYNSNNRRNVTSVEQVETYFLDPDEVTEENPTGRRLIDTITDVTTIEEGQYSFTLPLLENKYTIGNYVDSWKIQFKESDVIATIENNWTVYPDLWYTSPIPIVYDFNFRFSPNRIRQGSKRWLIINITPNVPTASELARYYQNLAIASPLTVSIVQTCGDCVPTEQDLRTVADQAAVELREKNKGFYFLDTTDMDCGIYDIWFQMEFGENLYISDKEQLQIF